MGERRGHPGGVAYPVDTGWRSGQSLLGQPVRRIHVLFTRSESQVPAGGRTGLPAQSTHPTAFSSRFSEPYECPIQQHTRANCHVGMIQQERVEPIWMKPNSCSTCSCRPGSKGGRKMCASCCSQGPRVHLTRTPAAYVVRVLSPTPTTRAMIEVDGSGQTPLQTSNTLYLSPDLAPRAQPSSVLRPPWVGQNVRRAPS